MAKIKQGILGGFSGKVASLVGTSWKGRAVMKSLPLSVANPRTESQVGQRNKFSKVAELASAILTQFVQPVENPIAGNISGYNLFCKDNKTAFNAAGELVGANLVSGGGSLPFPSDAEIITNFSEDEMTIEWTNDAAISPLRLTDKAYCVFMKDDGQVLKTVSGTVTRATKKIDLSSLIAEYDLSSGDDFVALLAFVSADGRDVSVKTNALLGTLS